MKAIYSSPQTKQKKMKHNYKLILKKSFFLFVLIIATALTGIAQTVFTYNAGPASADDRKPLGVYFGYERSQFIYTAAELGPLVPGSIITKLAFFLNTTNVPPGWDYIYKVYLKEKHLPNIASKKEIEKNGLQVSTVLSGITQNVEENTIDIVELYKKVIALEKENEKLKKEIENLSK